MDIALDVTCPTVEQGDEDDTLLKPDPDRDLLEAWLQAFEAVRLP